MGAFVLLTLFGIGLVAGPIIAGIMGFPIGYAASIICIVFGIFLVLLSTTLIIFTRLYVKTKANEAFVRTGLGGAKIVKDGGALVIPVVHQVVRVPLNSLRIGVQRDGAEALITADKLRADLSAEFFVQVRPDAENIKTAAKSFGEYLKDEAQIRHIIEDKLISALRTVAAKKTLEELNTNRDEFLKEVQQIVDPDIAHNGLALETATISKLDQTDPATLRDNNIFDAQGKRTIAEITQKQLTERNELEREGEQARKQQDVNTVKRILQMDLEKAAAEADQKSSIAKVNAEKQREAQEKQIESARQVELAKVEQERQVQMAKVQQEQAVNVAKQQQEQEVAVAERAKQKAVALAEQNVEVTRRAKLQAIANAEREQSAAEGAKAIVDAEREQALQKIKTVTVTAEAERQRSVQVVQAEAEAQKKFVTAQREADAQSYQTQKTAEGRKLAADAEAEAVLKRAKADSEAKKLAAEAEKALQFVPVQVKQQEVAVEQSRVENVLVPELQAREQHGRIAQEFELKKLEINAQVQVQMAIAEAVASMSGKIQAQVYGTPETAGNMIEAIVRGMKFATMTNGFFEAASPEVKRAAQGVAGSVENLVGSVASRLGDRSSKKDDSKKDDGK